jgi:hypothetical protein
MNLDDILFAFLIVWSAVFMFILGFGLGLAYDAPIDDTDDNDYDTE